MASGVAWPIHTPLPGHGVTCAYHEFGVGVDQTAFMYDGDQWQCPSDCSQKASTNY